MDPQLCSGRLAGGSRGSEPTRGGRCRSGRSIHQRALRRPTPGSRACIFDALCGNRRRPYVKMINPRWPMETDQVSDLLQPLLSSEEVRAMMDSVRDYALFLLDPSGKILTWNTGAQRLKGYSASEVVGKNFAVFYTEADRLAGRPATFLAAAAREGRAELEGWRVRKDGTLFWADAVISAIRDRSGRLQGYVKVTRDLTERRNAEEALRISEERLHLMIQSVEDYAIFLLDPS